MSDVGISVFENCEPPVAHPVEAGANDGGTDEADELPRLIHKAILARRFVAMHKHAARQCLRAARLAAEHGDAAMATSLLGDARDEHVQARTCTWVARDCESRAEALGIAAGAYAATGRGVRLR